MIVVSRYTVGFMAGVLAQDVVGPTSAVIRAASNFAVKDHPLRLDIDSGAEEAGEPPAPRPDRLAWRPRGPSSMMKEISVKTTSRRGRVMADGPRFNWKTLVLFVLVLAVAGAARSWYLS